MFFVRHEKSIKKDVFAFGCESAIKEIKENTKANTIVVKGYPSVFNNIDLHGDMIVKGAFEDTLKKNQRWPILMHHDSWRKIGFNMSGMEDEHGLYTEAEISLDTQDGREQAALSKLAFERQAKDARSIGFVIDKDEFETIEGRRIRMISKIDMWEDSFVTWGANPLAQSTDFKSQKQYNPTEKDLGLNEHVDAFFKFLEGLGHKPDDVKALMIQEHIKKEKEARLLSLINNTISTLNGGK